jgi:HSP90 family molecular chaperone
MPSVVYCPCLQAADSVEVARAAPFVEKLVADGYEVLYLTEAIDEAVVTNLAKFGEHDLVDVTKEGLDVGEDASKKVSSSNSSSSSRACMAWLKGMTWHKRGPQKAWCATLVGSCGGCQLMWFIA